VKRYRLFAVAGLGVVAVIIGFLAFSLNDTLVYYKTPTEVMDDADAVDDTRRLRLGGQVVDGSVTRTDGGVEFIVTDGINSIDVAHSGAPQQLFQEGIGVVVEGVWNGDVFRSDTMIIKHDEQYRSDDDGTYKPPAGAESAP
jgi:cytochrome c-type biogenesis protein CcmE